MAKSNHPVARKSVQELLDQALAFHKIGMFDEAEPLYDAVLKLDKHHAIALNLLGTLQAQRGNFAAAVPLLERSLKLDRRQPVALNNLGNAFKSLKRREEALASYAKAIALKPDYAEAHANRGATLQELKRHAEALASLDRALALKPDYAEAFNHRGNVLTESKRYDEALSAYDKAIALKPDYADAHANKGVLLKDARRYDEALASYDRAIRLDPARPYALGDRLAIKMSLCVWDGLQDASDELIAAVENGAPASSPFPMLMIPSPPELRRKCAEAYMQAKYPPSPSPLWRGEIYRHDRIRVAYVSGDFNNHAVAELMAGVFEHHDPKRFETIAIALGGDDGGEMRARLRRAFHRFIDAGERSDADVAGMIREMEVDIAVDLMGFTGDCRPPIFVHRPAPVQVNFLGFPGTIGASCMDYILADRVIIPERQRHCYSEYVVYLPDTYLPTDSQRPIAADTPTRAQAGLPDTGFVFCSFNNSYKFTLEIFAIWMRLLSAVENSVLWLAQANPTARRNLAASAEAHGVDPNRLVFAPFVQRMEDHLARLRLGDLFLDTLPYNAHTTACDALWAGLPVLTCAGKSFAGRVAASILNAAGLPELVTESLAGYENRALALARDPQALAALKQKLAQNRDTQPLFDTARFTRNLETAYTTMWNRSRQGQPPGAFSV